MLLRTVNKVDRDFTIVSNWTKLMIVRGWRSEFVEQCYQIVKICRAVLPDCKDLMSSVTRL